MHTMVRKQPEISKQIEDILQKNPKKEAILKDIRLQGMLLKNISGDIELIRHLSMDMITRVWKTQKIEELVHRSSARLHKLGIRPSVLRKHRFRYLKQLGDDLLTNLPNRLDASIPQGTLEVMFGPGRKKEKN